MKEFLVYTAMRIVLLVTCLIVVIGAWGLIAGEVSLMWAVLLAFVLSGIGSYFLLDRQREAFARRVEERAQQASTRYQEMRSREDAD